MTRELADYYKTLEAVPDTPLSGTMPIIVRVDGKNFSAATRALRQPFDDDFIHAMNHTAMAIAAEIGGEVKAAFTQSDEISLLMLPNENGEYWYGGRPMKMASVISSVATAAFNECNVFNHPARFDARVFNVPWYDVNDYFKWRQSDWFRNMVNMASYTYIAHKMDGVKLGQRIHMLRERGFDIDKIPVHLRHGTFFTKQPDLGFHPWVMTPDFRYDMHVTERLLKGECMVEDDGADLSNLFA